MPLDAVCLHSVVQEIRPLILDQRIEKIQQPGRDEIILLLHGRRLLLNAGANQPRIQLTGLLRDNPSQPPMFCMFLRKYIGNGRIIGLEQEPLERVVTLHIAATDELGEKSTYRLILECIGRHSNLILVGPDGRIMECMRRVDFEMSPERQVLPGLYYHLPPKQPDKCSPLEIGEEEFKRRLALCGRDQLLDQWILDNFTAVSPLVAREIVCRACGMTDARAGEERGRLWNAFSAWQKACENGKPYLLNKAGKPSDYSYFPIHQYGSYMECIACDTFSHMMDSFYEGREQADRVRQKGQELMKTAVNACHRIQRKIELQNKELAATQNRDHLRLCGELITANLYRIERGSTLLQAENYYDPDGSKLDIPLDPLLSPQDNAAKYFKKYNKAKTAEKMLTEQLSLGEKELRYMESVVQELKQAESEQDFAEIRAELTDGGYLRSHGKKKASFPRVSKPREFHSSSGLRILVGRNNRQNDRLTCKTASGRDIWFHTQKIHGSHVILFTDGAQPDGKSIEEAAMMAAYFSQGRDGTKIPVDYTPVRYVKKPAGAQPGMVIYTTYQTIYVSPDAEAVKKLSI